MPKTVFTKRDELICEKIENLIEEIKFRVSDVNDKISFIEQLHEIQYDAQRMENKDMTRNEELIEKYKRYIKKMEKQIETMAAPQALPLIAKISVYKMVIIDLQE
jgi:hypothetical protein